MAKPKALLVVHQERSESARVGHILKEYGFALDRCCPNLGEGLPETLDEHGIVVVFGGPMSANDRYCDKSPGIRQELDFMPTVLESRTPLLGICLGAQILAKALGARVARHLEGMAEVGYYRVTPTEAGREFLDAPQMFYQWHREGFEIPAGGELLATGNIYPNQAFRYGDKAYGVQFHPEVLEANIQRWSSRGSAGLKRPGARPKETHYAGFLEHDPTVDRWIRGFLARLCAGIPGLTLPAVALRGVEYPDSQGELLRVA